MIVETDFDLKSSHGDRGKCRLGSTMQMSPNRRIANISSYFLSERSCREKGPVTRPLHILMVRRVSSRIVCHRRYIFVSVIIRFTREDLFLFPHTRTKEINGGFAEHCFYFLRCCSPLIIIMRILRNKRHAQRVLKPRTYMAFIFFFIIICLSFGFMAYATFELYSLILHSVFFWRAGTVCDAVDAAT